MGQYLAERLSEELRTRVSVSSVTYYFFKRIQVRDLYLEDMNGDTLLYAGIAKARVGQFRPEPKGITFRKVTVEDAFVNLVIDTSGEVNISYFTDRLGNPHVPPEMKSRFHFASIQLLNARFSLTRQGSEHGSAPIDFSDFHLYGLNAEVSDLEVYQDTVSMEVRTLECRERSGFDFENIHTLLSISSQHMYFDDLYIQTAGSTLDIPVLRFDFDLFSNFSRFSTLVDLEFVSRSSDLALNDLDQFVPLDISLIDRISLEGRVHGKLSDLSGDDLIISSGDRSTLAFDFKMIGLPDISNTFLNFNFRQLNTSVLAIHDLLSDSDDQGPEELHPWVNFGQLDFRGRFTGYPDQFVASGLLESDLGKILMDLSFEPDSIRGVDFEGKLKTENFSLGRLLEKERNLNKLDMDVMAMGNLYKGRIRARLDGRIDTLDLYNYAYSNITLDGFFTNNTFEGGFSVSDPNIKLDFQGRTDFSGEVPVHRFTADVAHARPYYLNLPQSDPNYFISFLVETDLSGGSLDELNGEITLVNSLFERTGSQLQLYDVSLTTRNTPEASLVRIRSGAMDMDLTGFYKLTDLPSSFRNMADHYINILPREEPYRDTSTYFTYDIDFKRINPVLEFFVPDLKVAGGSHLNGTYDPLNKDISLSGLFPELDYRNLVWHNLRTRVRSGPDLLEAGYQSDSMTFEAAYALENQRMDFTVSRDTANLQLSWNNESIPTYSGELSMSGAFQPDSFPERGFVMELDPGIIVVKDQYWDVQSARILAKKDFLRIDSFEVTGVNKRIMANGLLSKEQGHDFILEASNLNLSQLPKIAGSNVQLDGNLSGNLHFRHSEGIPVITAGVEVDSLRFNKQLLGSTGLEATWDETTKSVRMVLSSIGENGFRFLEAGGEYLPRTQTLDFDIRMDRINLDVMEPYTDGLVRDLQGVASANLTVDGTLSKPELNGYLDFENGAVTFDFLNTRYNFNDRIRIYHNNLYAEEFGVTDPNGQRATVNGSLSDSYLKDPYINLTIEAADFLLMNTRAMDNEDFYGNITATGNILIQGEPRQLGFQIQARSEKNTAVYLPLYQASEVETNDFLTYIHEKETPVESSVRRSEKFSGLSMEIDAEVTNDALVQLIFDPEVGDIIETSGKGNLRMNYDPVNGFRIFGDVVLEQGNYLFTLQNVINKRFEIEPGGQIRFSGSPMDASIDLEAIYTLRAAPYNLYPDVDEKRESLKRRIPVECHLTLQGELGEPTISTGISMPTADAETRNLLENSTSTDEEMMKQFLSLLVINNFYSVSGYAGQQIGTTSEIAGVTASELLSNQLSNWLSQISDDFDIGVNYRPGDEITRNEVEVALSTQLLDNRIIISGNVDVGGQNPTEGNTPNIMGDFDVEFRVTDNISVIAFNRARDELLFETAPYKQGVGISYREDFDNLNQLMNRYREAIVTRKLKKKKDTGSQQDE